MTYYVEKAIQLIREVENEKAIKYLQDILKEDTQNAEVFRILGLAHFNLGNHAEAKTHWRKCVELEPLHHQTWWNLGQVYEVLGNFENANEAYEKAALSSEQDFPEKAIRYRKWVKKT